MNSPKDAKRIAKNTIYLYLRQMISILISLYTSRVVLSALGVVDYGIYNVVGGIVVLFSFISTSGAQRFLAYDLEKGDLKKLNETFLPLYYVMLKIIRIHILLRRFRIKTSMGENTVRRFVSNRKVFREICSGFDCQSSIS